MDSDAGIKLTSKDKVLLHLRDHWKNRGDREYTQAVTQKGISEMTGLRLSHVPRTLQGLLAEELVNEVKAHVRGEKRRYKVYVLSEKGITEVGRILKDLMEKTVVVDGAEVRVGDVLDRENEAHRFRLLLRLAGEEISSIKRKPVMAGPIPDVSDFVNRKEELAQLEAMLADPVSRVMLVYGSHGYGTSTLAAKFAAAATHQWSVGWLCVEKSMKKMRIAIEQVLRALGLDITTEIISNPKKLAKELDGKNILLVFDGYFEVADETVEYFAGLVAALRETEGFKIVVTGREDTPPYNRFYTIIDIHDGIAGEVHVRGLDVEHCRVLLGEPKIEADALRRLFLFTRGCPTTLKLLARGNEKEMREKSRFSPEEIKLMLWLKGQKKNQ